MNFNRYIRNTKKNVKPQNVYTNGRNEYSTFASSMNAKHRFGEYTEKHRIVVSKWARLTTKRIMQLMF